MAVGEDFRFPQTTGPKPAGIDLLNRYIALMHRATLSDHEVTRAFLKVMNLQAPLPSLMRPGMMVRVLRAVQCRVAAPGDISRAGVAAWGGIWWMSRSGAAYAEQ
jgi:hypothetical protein